MRALCVTQYALHLAYCRLYLSLSLSYPEKGPELMCVLQHQTKNETARNRVKDRATSERWCLSVRNSSNNKMN